MGPETRAMIALAWDTGAVTTGPVTVPLVLALGLGVSAILGKSDTGMSGFGIVTLASLWPVIMVSSLGLILFLTGSYISDIDAAAAAADAGGDVEVGSYIELVRASMFAAVQAIIPLTLLLMFVQRVVLREPIRDFTQIVVGIIFCTVGLLLFSRGLSTGLVVLGDQVGSNVPAAFAPPEDLYGDVPGRIIAIAFTFVLGYGATMAEPALNALGMTVEEVTAGAFKKALLIQAVAVGVAVGVSVGLSAGMAKVMFDLPMTFILVPPTFSSSGSPSSATRNTSTSAGTAPASPPAPSPCPSSSPWAWASAPPSASPTDSACSPWPPSDPSSPCSSWASTSPASAPSKRLPDSGFRLMTISNSKPSRPSNRPTPVKGRQHHG